MLVRCSHKSILPDYSADIVSASLSKSYCAFLSLISPSIVIFTFYILSKRLRLKLKELSVGNVLPLTKKKKKMLKLAEVFKFNIGRMINCDLLKLSPIWNFEKRIYNRIIES